MEIDNAINYFGTKENLAHHSEVSISTVRRWIERGEIPIKEQIFLEWKTNGNLKADKEMVAR